MRGGPPTKLYRAGAESRERIGALGGVEVAEAVVHEARARGEAAAAQHVVRVEPGLRVVAIGVGVEAGVRRERGRGPLPDPAQELAKPALARARIRQRKRRATVAQVERLARSGLVSPREAIHAAAVACRIFPLALGRQPALRPRAIGERLLEA